MTNRTGAVPRV